MYSRSISARRTLGLLLLATLNLSCSAFGRKTTAPTRPIVKVQEPCLTDPPPPSPEPMTLSTLTRTEVMYVLWNRIAELEVWSRTAWGLCGKAP